MEYRFTSASAKYAPIYALNNTRTLKRKIMSVQSVVVTVRQKKMSGLEDEAKMIDEMQCKCDEEYELLAILAVELNDKRKETRTASAERKCAIERVKLARRFVKWADSEIAVRRKGIEFDAKFEKEMTNIRAALNVKIHELNCL